MFFVPSSPCHVLRADFLAQNPVVRILDTPNVKCKVRSRMNYLDVATAKSRVSKIGKISVRSSGQIRSRPKCIKPKKVVSESCSTA